MGQLSQTPGTPSRNFVTNAPRVSDFSIMTSSSPSINTPVQNVLDQSSNLLGHLPPQQVVPSVVEKSNNLGNI